MPVSEIVESIGQQHSMIEVVDEANSVYGRVRVKEPDIAKASIFLTADQLDAHARGCMALAVRLRERSAGIVSKAAVEAPIEVLPGVYRHHGGTLYRVLYTMYDTSKTTEGRMLVCYVSLTSGKIHAREAGEFVETIYRHLPSGRAFTAEEYLRLSSQNSPLKSDPFRICRRFELQEAL